LWAGLKDSAPLLELKRRIDEVLAESIGLGAEYGLFSPHITLSRRRTDIPPALRDQIKDHSFTSETFAVESFTLFRSVLLPAGASHSPLEIYPFLSLGV
jgi:2'-5' RNA ligase